MENALSALWAKVDETWRRHKVCIGCPHRVAVLASPLDVPSPASETDSFCAVIVNRTEPEQCAGVYTSLSIATQRYTPETERQQRARRLFINLLWAAFWIACASLVLAYRQLSR